MNEQLDWLVPGRVLYAARSGEESLADLAAFTQQTVECLEKDGQWPVHLIWNMTGLNVDGVDHRAAMEHLTQLMKHKKVKWFLVVEQDRPFWRRFIFQTLLRLSGIRWQAVDSKAAGLAFLRQRDGTLG